MIHKTIKKYERSIDTYSYKKINKMRSLERSMCNR